MRNQSDTTLIQALQNAALYDHPVTGFTVVETHISWVILTGDYAYKIKKPVDLGFLDFSTLEKRHFYCEEELRLNRRLAPQLYLAVVAITGSVANPQLNGSGPAIEYAVKMRQFHQDRQFDRLLARDGLRPGHIDRVAELIAGCHAHAAVARPDTPYGSPALVWQPVAENYQQILPLLRDEKDVARLQKLQQWFSEQRTAHEARFIQRKAAGYIRECHGDLHLANIALFEDEVLIFDCLEFNDRLRWIDVISDAAFLVMDLESRGQRALAWRFLNDYLHHSGDYEALPLLPYYLAYRAMVRAKVASIRRGQERLDDQAKTAAEQEFQNYLALAESYSRPRRPALFITHGLSGSGKTTITQPLLENLGAVRIRSDVERKRLFGMDSEQSAAAAPAQGLYSAAASECTYQRLAELAGTVIEAGFPVVVDATFLRREWRMAFHELARQLGVPFLILHCHAPQALLRRWIVQRRMSGGDASDADLAVLDHQLATQEPLTAQEQQWTVDIDTTQAVDGDALYREVAARLAEGL
ncbi:MAG: AAA family ATPase [Gammaproteobacteria bacterium]